MNKSSYFEKKPYCIYCLSKLNNSMRIKNNLDNNFYINYISRELSLSKEQIDKIIKVYECRNCNLIQNNPWFNNSTANKIYSSIYGHHHKGWTNFNNFIKKKTIPNHGKLLNIISKIINIKKYCEYSCPYSGLFFELNLFRWKKIKKLKKLYIKLNILKQTGDKNIYQIKKNNILSKKTFFKINKLLEKKSNNYLLYDNSDLCWGQNCNQESINCKTLSNNLFNTKIINSNYNGSFDVFGFFSTLDHTFDIKKTLNWALNKSKLVIINGHSDKNITKQHLFVLNHKFLNKIYSQKMFFFDITQLILREFKREELYYLCTKDKKIAKKITIILNKIKLKTD